MNSNEKALVIQYILNIVGSFVALNEAHIMLLGGMGFDAKLCLQAGALENNINIIERKRSLMKKLMRLYPEAHTFQGSLKNAVQMLKAVHGRNVGMDFMHLDLCGTIDPIREALVPVMKLCVNGRTGCLAVTTADQRFNHAIHDPDAVIAKSYYTFGHHAKQLFDDLKEVHEFVQSNWNGTVADPYKVALRELSMYNHIAEACGHDDSHASILPDSLIRIIFSADGFRMRTYLFHVKKRERSTKSEEVGKKFVDLVRMSPCYYLIQNQLVLVPRQERKGVAVMTHTKEIAELRKRLEPIWRIVSPAVKVDLDRLFEMAESGDAMRAVSAMEETLSQIKSNYSASSSNTEPADVVDEATPVDDSSEPVESVQPESNFVPIKASPAMVVKDKVRMMFLIASSVPDSAGRQRAMDEASKKAARMLGLSDAQNQGDILRGIYARAMGRFRSAFVARQLLRYPDGAKREQMLKKLAKAYGETQEILLEEAQAHSFWKKAYLNS
jgi:hypothetical protein